MSKIRVLVSPKGDVKIAPSGAPGPSCLDLTKFLEEGLGVVQDRRETDEMYEKELSNELYESA